MALKTTRFRSRIAYVAALIVLLLCAVPVTLSLVTVNGIDLLLRHHLVRAEAAALAVVAGRVRQTLLDPVGDGARLMASSLNTAAANNTPAATSVAGLCRQLSAIFESPASSQLFSMPTAVAALSGGTARSKCVHLPLKFTIVDTPGQSGDAAVTWNAFCRLENRTNSVGDVVSLLAAPVTANATAVPQTLAMEGPSVLPRLLPLPESLSCSLAASSVIVTSAATSSNTTEWLLSSWCKLPLVLSQDKSPPLSLFLHASTSARADDVALQLADPLTVSVMGTVSRWGWAGVAVVDSDSHRIVLCLLRGAVVANPSLNPLCEIMASEPDAYSETAATSTVRDGHTLTGKVEVASSVRWVIIAMSDSGASEPIVRARGIVLVTSFCITALTIFLLIVMLRMLTQPLRAIVASIKALTQLRLDDIGLIEASSVSEVRDIQKSVSYLAIRLYHYIRFLPDPSVLQGLLAECDEGSSEGDEDEALDGGSGGMMNNSSGGGKRNEGRPDASRGAGGATLHVPLLRPATTSGPKKPRHHAAGNVKSVTSAVHSIGVDLMYESRKVDRNTASRRFQPNKSATFAFTYRVHDPVFTKLVRACREQLREHPGECLLVFAHTPHGQRQLVCDEDVFCAFELDSDKDPHTGPTIRLTVRKGSKRNFLPLGIAVGTFLSTMSRFLLCVERLADPDVNVQFLGLVLLCCIGMQVAQNTLIALYLVRRFASLDVDFRSWLAVAQTEAILSILCGSLNITNITVMSCNVRLSRKLRLNAPLSPPLLEKISSYSLVGFILGDLIPFSFILIDVVLKDKYEDPFVILSTVFSLFSVSSILVQHALTRFIINTDRYGGTGGTSSAQWSSSSPSRQHPRRRAQLLSRRDVTLVRVAVSEEELLLEFLSPPVAEVLCETFFTTVTGLARRFGGALVELKGLSCVVAFNVQSHVLQHAAAGLELFLALQKAVEVQVLEPFFVGERFRLFLSNELAGAAFKTAPAGNSAVPSLYFAAPPSQLLALFHQNHRLVGSIVTGEMAIGVAGSLTSQTLQHVGLSAVLSRALCSMNEWYGSTLLINDEAAEALDWATSTVPAFRRIDQLQPGDGMFIPCMTRSRGLPLPTGGDGEEDDSASGREVQEAPKVVVFEGVVTTFAPCKKSDSAAGVSGVHRWRCQRPDVATCEAVRRFTDAFDVLVSLSNSTPLTLYLEANPHDAVAGRVMRWAQFLCGRNSRKAVVFPRLLTHLGISQHACELDPLMELEVDVADPASEAVREIVEKQKIRDRLLRPPRSVRRAAQRRSHQCGEEGSGNASGARVIDRMLTADRFHVSFQRGQTTDIEI